MQKNNFETRMSKYKKYRELIKSEDSKSDEEIAKVDVKTSISNKFLSFKQWINNLKDDYKFRKYLKYFTYGFFVFLLACILITALILLSYYLL